MRQYVSIIWAGGYGIGDWGYGWDMGDIDEERDGVFFFFLTIYLFKFAMSSSIFYVIGIGKVFHSAIKYILFKI